MLWLWDRSPYGRYLDHGRLGEIGHDGGTASVFLPVTLYLVGWTLMTAAMMLPTTGKAPATVLIRSRVT